MSAFYCSKWACFVWCGQVAISFKYSPFEVSLGFFKKEWQEIRIAGMHTCFLASSSEEETDVGRMNEKQHSLAHLSDAIIGKQGWSDCWIAPGGPESYKEPAFFLDLTSFPLIFLKFIAALLTSPSFFYCPHTSSNSSDLSTYHSISILSITWKKKQHAFHALYIDLVSIDILSFAHLVATIITCS